MNTVFEMKGEIYICIQSVYICIKGTSLVLICSATTSLPLSRVWYLYRVKMDVHSRDPTEI